MSPRDILSSTVRVYGFGYFEMVLVWKSASQPKRPRMPPMRVAIATTPISATCSVPCRTRLRNRLRKLCRKLCPEQLRFQPKPTVTWMILDVTWQLVRRKNRASLFFTIIYLYFYIFIYLRSHTISHSPFSILWTCAVSILVVWGVSTVAWIALICNNMLSSQNTDIYIYYIILYIYICVCFPWFQRSVWIWALKVAIQSFCFLLYEDMRLRLPIRNATQSVDHQRVPRFEP